MAPANYMDGHKRLAVLLGLMDEFALTKPVIRPMACPCVSSENCGGGEVSCYGSASASASASAIAMAIRLWHLLARSLWLAWGGNLLLQRTLEQSRASLTIRASNK